jgi:hypothetical protein
MSHLSTERLHLCPHRKHLQFTQNIEAKLCVLDFAPANRLCSLGRYYSTFSGLPTFPGTLRIVSNRPG